MIDLSTALVNGVVLGAITLLAALGLHYTFGLLGLVNLTHAESMVLGGYAAFVAQEQLGSPVVGMLAAPLVAAVVGLVVERLLLRKLYDRPLDSLLLTFGLALVLRQGFDFLFSNTPRRVLDPIEGSVTIADVALARWRVVVVLTTLVLCAALRLVMDRSDLGLRIRATIANHEMASAIGLDAARLRLVVFCVGSAVAGLAGALLAPLFTLDPQFGMIFLVNALVAVILGRLGSLVGLVGASLAIGLSTTLLQLTMSAVFAQVLVLLAAMLAIRFRSAVGAHLT